MFEYYGKIETLREELNSFRGLLETAYKNILGQELYDTVDEAEKTFINENSFIEKPNQECGFDCSSSLEIATSTNDKNEPTKILRTLIKPIFHLSDDGCKKFSAKTGLSLSHFPAFIHCFNNFIIYLIQEIPMVYALKIISNRFYSDLESDATQKMIENFSPGKIGVFNKTEDHFKIGNFDDKRILKIITNELYERTQEEQIKEDMAMLFAGIIINGSLVSSVLAMDRQIFLEMGFNILKYPRHEKALARQIASVMCTYIWRFLLQWRNGNMYGKNN